ncbi:MAG TPA: peptidylprolyl isomerase, partial [Gammaproteobacteria bacterium]
MRIPFALPLAALFAVSLVGCQSDEGGGASAPAAGGEAPAAAAAPQRLTPLPGKESTAPALTQVTKVRLATTAGDLVIEVYPQAGPNAAKRFIELVTSGFFD